MNPRPMGPAQRRVLTEMQQFDERRKHRHADQELTIRELMPYTMLQYRQVESAMAKLKRRGLVEEAGRVREQKQWRLTELGGRSDGSR